MFTLTKLTPPPPVLLFNLTICLCFSLPVQAKIIQRKMHMVCQEHESAYWDGSKGVCCDGTVYQPDTEDTSYACCPTGKEVSIVQGKENLNYCCSEGQIAGAVDGVFCGGYTLATYTLNEKFIEDWPEIDCGNGGRTTSYSYDIYQNGGVYYCANTYNDKNRKSSFESPSQNCTYEYYEGEWLLNFCLCSDKGDPRNNGEPCDP